MVGGHIQGPVEQRRRKDMKTQIAKLALIILGALVLIASSANARTEKRGHAPAETQYQSSGGLYGSFSQGAQPYANPDRELYVNRSCCSWKSSHKHKPIKH
jgi:hypothetical protein